MEIEGREVTTEGNQFDPVTYVPHHANGNAQHPDAEQGVIVNVRAKLVGVLYCKSRTIQMTNPDELVWG